MHKLIAAVLMLLIMVAPAFSQAAGTENDAHVALDQIAEQLKQVFGELTALDDSDRKLTISNKTQSDTTELLNRSERRIKTEEIPALQQRARDADEMRQRLIDMGCPPEGGVGPIDLVNKCNPLAREHRNRAETILKDMEIVKEQLATIANTRQAVSDTTLANARQQKANNDRRNQLLATRLQLYGERIRRSLTIVKNRAIASQACKSLPNAEEATCCLSVIWDGADPNRCGIELIYKVFERSGVFSSTEIRPVR